MKKNFWSFLAVLLAALFVSGTSVQAADISFGGQLLERAQMVDKDPDLDANDWSVAQRLRVNTTVKASGVTMFSQLVHTHTWSTNAGPGTDGNEDVGVHQAHLTLPNFFDSGWTAKLGRQEVVLDGHRIFGHTGWHLDAVTHDAATLINPAWDLTYVLSYMANEGEANVNGDAIAHVLRKGLSLAGGKTALYWVTVDDDQAGDGVMWHTAGIRQVGKAAGYDYRVEYYQQFGTVLPANAVGTSIANKAADISEAFMFGARMGKKVNNTKVTLWYDYVSGTDDAQVNANEVGAWNQLYDTGHKFYGLIDEVAPGANTDRLGLQDLALKFVHPVAPGWTLKADFHQFWTAVDPGDNMTAWVGTNESASDGKEIGHEIDLTLKTKYNANTAVQFGYSYFNPTTTWMHIDGDTTDENSNWLYAQVNFTY
jgi:hypothetical protein